MKIKKTQKKTGMDAEKQSIREFAIINNQHLVNTQKMRVCEGTRVSSHCQIQKGRVPETHMS